MIEEKFRYRVGHSLGERIVLLTINAIFIIIIWCIFFKESEYTSENIIILTTVSVTSTMQMLLIVNEKIDVYKGKCVYRKYIRKRTCVIWRYSS